MIWNILKYIVWKFCDDWKEEDLCEWYKKMYNKAKGLFINARWNKKVSEKRELVKMLSRIV